MMLKRYFQNSRYMQYTAAIIATLSIPCSTIYTTWASPALPKLQSPDSPIGRPITSDEGSWIASVPILAVIPGGLLLGLIAGRFPRKTFLLFSAIPLFIPWLVCIFAKSATAIIVSRFVAGIGLSITHAFVPIYVGEIAEKDIRGKLGALFNTFKLSGALVVLCIGPFVSYTAIAIICSVFPIIFFALFVFMPESPYYLVKKGKYDSAEKVLKKISADQQIVKNNLEEIVKTVDFDMQNRSPYRDLLFNTKCRKSLILMLGLKTFQQFSGMNAIEAYMQTIIESSGSSITPEISSIICGFVQIPAVLLAAFLVDRIGRKPLWIISCLGCAVALVAEGVYFYLKDELLQNVENISWLPTVALMFYLIMNPLGLYTLPYVFMGELFATNIKDVAASICVMYGGLIAFIVTKFFKPLSDLWGMYTIFWVFAGVCIIGAATVYFLYPETKGKTFLEIQEQLNPSSKIKINTKTVENSSSVRKY